MSHADHDHETMLKKLYHFTTHSFIPLPSVETSFSLEMLLLLDLKAEIIDYAKAMPEAGKAEDLDFEVWGKGFCERMVSSLLNIWYFVHKTGVG
jgi:hypothetical protein